MRGNFTQDKLEQALETYARLVEAYPDNEDFLQQYADMLQSLGRETTATITLQHLYDVISQRSEKEAQDFAKKHPQIGRISHAEIVDAQDAHRMAGKIIDELLGALWLRIHQKKYSEGQVICRSEQHSDSLMLVRHGHLDTYTLDAQQHRIFLGSVGAYDILGEQTFFHSGHIGFDAFVSSTSAIVVAIPHQKMTAMLSNNTYLKDMLSQRSVFRYLVRSIALHPLFRALPLKLSQYLARHTTRQSFSANSMILNPQHTVSGIYIIIAGKACYLAENHEGKKIPLSPLQANSLAGDLLLQGQQAILGHELLAVTQVHALFIPREQLLNIREAFPPLMNRLTQYAEQQRQHVALSLRQGKHA